MSVGSRYSDPNTLRASEPEQCGTFVLSSFPFRPDDCVVSRNDGRHGVLLRLWEPTIRNHKGLLGLERSVEHPDLDNGTRYVPASTWVRWDDGTESAQHALTLRFETAEERDAIIEGDA